MANLLSLRLSARDVIPLFVDDDGPAQHLRLALDRALTSLRDVPGFESHEDLSSLKQTMDSLAAANMAATPVKWWTGVTVSKVLHRRRPHIVPLIDSRIHRFCGTKHPELLLAALWEDIRENISWLSHLAATKNPGWAPAIDPAPSRHSHLDAMTGLACQVIPGFLYDFGRDAVHARHR